MARCSKIPGLTFYTFVFPDCDKCKPVMKHLNLNKFCKRDYGKDIFVYVSTNDIEYKIFTYPHIHSNYG